VETVEYGSAWRCPLSACGAIVFSEALLVEHRRMHTSTEFATEIASLRQRLTMLGPPAAQPGDPDIVVRVVLPEDRVHVSRSSGAVAFTVKEWWAVSYEVLGQLFDQGWKLVGE
jgi:hypothetical protein